MLLLIGSLLFLVLLIARFRLTAFLALLLTAILTGFGARMAPEAILQALQNGVGSTLGSLVLVLGLGMLLGNLLAETGATHVIATRLLVVFGPQHATWALALTGTAVGLAMFYNAGFVVLAPLAFSLAAQARKPLVPLAIAMAAPLSVTHGFLPPHPGATAVANLLHANLGKTLLLGLLIAAPTVAVAALLFPRFLKNIPANPPSGMFPEIVSSESPAPGFGVSLFVALLPVLLMGAATVAELGLPAGHPLRGSLKFAGDGSIAMLVSVLAALLLLSGATLKNATTLLTKTSGMLGPLAMLLLVIAAGGAFKQVLVDSGIGKTLAERMQRLPLSPLLLGWGIATVLRIAVGSATVAGMTAAGIIQPLMATSGVSPELMTLAVGAGSLMCSHVNDTGFWMFREWFGLSLRDTFRSWTAMETIVGLMGLLGVLLLNRANP